VTETTTVPSTGADGTSGAAHAIEVENPATGHVIATVPVVAPGDVAGLVERARRAQLGWDALGFDGRAAVMKRCQKWLSDNAERVIETIVAETGKAYEEALLAEVSYAEGAFAFWAKNAEKYLADERVKTASPFVKGRKLIVRHEPVGVVGVIGPWNYPLTNSFGDCIPALMAGNSVLLKPSEVTPLTSMLMGEMLRECGLPEDV
jgi:acyl-CoA reductase-like NAD-dependent aldehyde dehydrogenase